MPHRATPRFWALYRALPKSACERADTAFALLKRSSDHPSLHLKKIKGREGLWSARAGHGYRALAREVDDGLSWFWIGSHDEYDRLIG